MTPERRRSDLPATADGRTRQAYRPVPELAQGLDGMSGVDAAEAT